MKKRLQRKQRSKESVATITQAGDKEDLNGAVVTLSVQDIKPVAAENGGRTYNATLLWRSLMVHVYEY